MAVITDTSILGTLIFNEMAGNLRANPVALVAFITVLGTQEEEDKILDCVADESRQLKII